MTADAVPVDSRRRAGSWALRILRLAVISYVAVLGFLYAAQAWLIFPGRWSQGRIEAQIEPPVGTELLRVTTASGARVVALFGPALDARGRVLTDASTRPTILFFYGNGDFLANNVDLFEEFRRLGANVAIAEYAGFGLSEGSPGEVGCRETAEAVFDHLVSRPDVNPSRILAAGWSLGSGVAVDLASRRGVSGLVLFSSFTSMVDMARQTYPFIPVSWLLSHRFESEAKLRELACPVFLAHGTDDRTIPFAMSERLVATAPGPTTLYPVTGARHDDLFVTGGARLMEAVGLFLESQKDSG